MKPVRVWDPLVRGLHGLLVLGVAGAWITTEWWSRWHERIGYAVLAIISLRIVWGFVGPATARFRGFVRRPSTTLAYARLMLRSREPRHVGHNPLGAWMIVALLLCLAVICATGLLFLTDAFWGDPLVSAIHEYAAWGLLGLVALHVFGVVHASLRHRENLVRAMLTGAKRPPGPRDIG